MVATVSLGNFISTLITGAVAYLAACKIETIWARVLGIAYLAVKAFFMLALGIQGAVVPLLLGLACASAAVHAWWHTRY